MNLRGERDLRWNRLRAGMSEHGIDCLIIIGNAGSNLYRLADLQYLTGTSTGCDILAKGWLPAPVMIAS
jgi:hypothetical protein